MSADLAAFAQRYFRLSASGEQGALPRLPASTASVWSAYLRLRRRTPVGMAGLQPVSWLAVDAFSRLTGRRFAPWELRLLEHIDNLFLYPEEAAAGAAVTRPMSEKLFDAMFS